MLLACPVNPGYLRCILAIAPLIEAPGIGSFASARPRTKADREQTREVRRWAEARGIGVSAEGRIPQSVLDEYEQTHDPRAMRTTLSNAGIHVSDHGRLPQDAVDKLDKLSDAARAVADTVPVQRPRRAGKSIATVTTSGMSLDGQDGKGPSANGRTRSKAVPAAKVLEQQDTSPARAGSRGRRRSTGADVL